MDGRILELSAPRVPDKEPTVYHIAQLRKVLAACNPVVPTEDARRLAPVGPARHEAATSSPMAHASSAVPLPN